MTDDTYTAPDETPFSVTIDSGDPDEDADVEGADSGLNEDAPVEPEEN
jgi:hypothetical protein